MRVPALPLPLALAVVALLCAPPAECTAPSPTRAPAVTATPPARWVRPRFAPPEGYRIARVRRQDSAVAGDTAATSDAAGGGSGDTGTRAATTTAGGAAQETTTPADAATTTQPVQQTTTQAATTTSAAAPTTTDAQQQTTSQAQTTSPAATTTPGYATTTTPGASPSSDGQLPASSSSSAPASQSSAGPSSAVGPSSAASESSATSSSMTLSDVTSTYTSTFTNSDGSIGTSTGTHVTQSAVPVKNNSSSSSTGKTWGIIGGVVGGVVVVAALVFIAYRMTQKRFSSIDDDDVEFKWPELQPDGQTISTNTSTLKPLETHRSGAHGIGDDGDALSSYGGPAGDVRAAGALYAPADARDPHAHGGYADPYASHSRQASYEALAMADGGAAAYARGYDPYPGGPIHAPVSAPYGYAGAQGVVYPPSPPQYRSSAGSAGSSPYAPQGAFGVPHHQSEEEGHLVPAAGAPRPMGAPGAGGAAVGALPRIERSESPFEVPGLGARSSELHGDDEKEDKEARRGPL
ncbi:hypothetical protein JCM10450v2_006724 [Rhodotorula kratochvilovae]